MDPYHKRARRIAASVDPLSAVARIVNDLTDKLPLRAALEIALEAARHARRRAPRERYAQALLSAAGGDIVAAAGILATIAGPSDDPSMQFAAASAAMLSVRPRASNDPAALTVLRHALRVATWAARTGERDSLRLVCEIGAHEASRTAEAAPPVERLPAVDHLRGLIAAYDHNEIVRRVFRRGVLEHNLARALTRAPGDPASLLLEARGLLELALTRDDRRSDPKSEALTRGELAGVLRNLAARGGEDREELLRAALGHAERAERLAITYGGQLDLRDAQRARRRAAIELAAATGNMDELQRMREELDAFPDDLDDPREASLRSAVARALGEIFPQTAEQLDRVLDGLVRATGATERLTESHALLLTRCLLADTGPGAARQPRFAHLLGLTAPGDVGLALARRVRDAQVAWLEGRTDDPEHARRLEDAMACIEGHLGNPRLSISERRFFGSWGNQLAGLALRAGAPTPGEVLTLIDLSGAAAYRSDASFFGIGSLSGPERKWRRELYRTRVRLDLEAERCDPAVDPDAPGDTAVSVSVLLDDGEGLVASSREPATAIELERANLAALCAGGRSWMKGFSVPAPRANELERWLRKHPRIAVLVAAPPAQEQGPQLALAFAQGSSVRLEPLPLPAGEEPLHQLVDLSLALAEPPRARTPDGRVISIDEARQLEPEEQRALVVDDLNADDIASGERTLKALLHAVGPAAARIAAIARGQELTSLRILSRGPWAWFPWEAVPLDDTPDAQTLGELLALVHVPTMAPLAHRKSAQRSEVLSVVGTRLGSGSVVARVAAAVGESGRTLRTPIDMESFESALARARIVRFIGHGAHVPGWPGFSGLELDDERLGAPEKRYQACEARASDLAGVERFEVWACEAGSGLDLRGAFRGEDEPTSMAASLLVGGARRVVAAPWVQPARMVALIAGFFARAPETTSGEADARRLATAVRAARQVTSQRAPELEARSDWPAEAVRSFLGPVAAPAVDGPTFDLGAWAYAGWRIVARDRDC